jgi:hypothetical protein
MYFLKIDTHHWIYILNLTEKYKAKAEWQNMP